MKTAVTDAVEAWAASGAMALTGRADEPPLGPPAPLVDGIRALGARITERSGVELDWLALLGERAALQGLTRAGTTSCGGQTRLLPTADGWIAVALARPEDVDLIPAWLDVDADDIASTDPWPVVTDVVASRTSEQLVEDATLLGLPVGARGERHGEAVIATALGTGRSGAETELDKLVVVDLSALWAGPLCASIFALAGADVVKVEAQTRPDGARRHPSFYGLLNGRKRRLDETFTAADLLPLLTGADVVIESSRPRALEQLGIVAAEVVAAAPGPRVWVSITGHGRASPRVAFGDDAAVAGGLVVEDDAGPCFCADAVADPITGLTAAAAALESLAAGGRWLIDVAMAGVSAEFAGPTLPAGDVAPAPPRARTVS